MDTRKSRNEKEALELFLNDGVITYWDKDGTCTKMAAEGCRVNTPGRNIPEEGEESLGFTETEIDRKDPSISDPRL